MKELEELIKVDTKNVSVDTLIETQNKLKDYIYARLNSMTIKGITKIVEIERQIMVEELTPRTKPIVDEEQNNEDESNIH